MKAPVSLTARVSLLFAAAAASVLLVSGTLFGHAAENHFLQNDTEELYGKMEFIRRVLTGITSPDAAAQLPSRIGDARFGHPGLAISIVTDDHTVLYSTGPADIVSHLRASTELVASRPIAWSSGDRTYRIVANRLPLGATGSLPVSVAVALDISGDRSFMAEFEQFLWFGMALAMAIMAVLGWAAVHRGLLPLRKLSQKVATTSVARLDEPLPVAGVPPELRELVLAFNRMLARIDDSFRRLSEFSSDLAHELRTPIHNMLIQSQVTLSQERAPEIYRAALQANIEDLERLSAMASDMLFIARADNRLLAPTCKPIELHQEVEQLLAFYEAYAAGRGVGLRQSGTATVSGDRPMLQRALSNLLSNAIRFTPTGGEVTVAISQDADATEVGVTNPGPQIPAEHLSRIFERLYRIDPSRQEGEADHAGLGLAIAKSIVELHGGHIDVQSAAGRTCFTVRLPQAPAINAPTSAAPHADAPAEMRASR